MSSKLNRLEMNTKIAFMNYDAMSKAYGFMSMTARNAWTKYENAKQEEEEYKNNH